MTAGSQDTIRHGDNEAAIVITVLGAIMAAGIVPSELCEGLRHRAIYMMAFA